LLHGARRRIRCAAKDRADHSGTEEERYDPRECARATWLMAAVRTRRRAPADFFSALFAGEQRHEALVSFPSQ
jgi:hypothetical protein